MKYLTAVLLLLGLISAACGGTQRDAASPTQTTSPETASTPTAGEMLMDSQSARIDALKENMGILESKNQEAAQRINDLESTIEELKSKNQDAAQRINDLEAESEDLESKNQGAAQQINDLESKNQEAAQRIDDLEAESEEWEELLRILIEDNIEMELILNDLRCRTRIDIELVLGGCDWESPESMPPKIGGWTLSRYDDGDTLHISYWLDSQGADPPSPLHLSLYCVWGANPWVLLNIWVGEDLHEADEDVVNVDYQIGDTERFEIPWMSWVTSGSTTLSPDSEYIEMVLDDLRSGEGTLEVVISVDNRPPLRAVFETDGIVEVYNLLEPGCRSTNTGLRDNAA